MDELEQRIDLLQQAGFVDETGRKDLDALVEVLTEGHGVPRDSEQLGSLVTHVAAAFKRAADGELIDPIAEEVYQGVKESEVYAEAEGIRDEIVAAMATQLSEDEKEFILVHVGGLLMAMQA